jgi:hypothetical protein
MSRPSKGLRNMPCHTKKIKEAAKRFLFWHFEWEIVRARDRDIIICRIATMANLFRIEVLDTPGYKVDKWNNEKLHIKISTYVFWSWKRLQFPICILGSPCGQFFLVLFDQTLASTCSSSFIFDLPWFHFFYLRVFQSSNVMQYHLFGNERA